jgi:outer membrane protein insertion porin family
VRRRAHVVSTNASRMTAFRRSRFALALLLMLAAGCKEEGSGVEVKSLKLIGHKSISDGDVRSVLATVVSSKLPWGQKEYFDREQFEADLKRIIAFYQDRGFPDAKIRSFDAKLSADQKSVDLRIEIVEGEPMRVERVDFVGFDPVPQQHLRTLENRIPLKVGAPLDRALVQASREAAVDELKDHGYPFPKVSVEEMAGASERQRIVKYTADPGRLAYFGPVTINGTASVNERIVRRQLTFRRGQLFEQSKLRESQRRLYSMELFNFVNVEASNPVQADGTVLARSRQLTGQAAGPDQNRDADQIDTRVTVTEGKHRKVNFGFGYGSEEKGRAEIDWRHVNFFGGARTAGVVVRSLALDRGVRLNLKQPYFFGPHYSFSVSGQSWFSDEPTYKLTTTGGRATISREFVRSRTPLTSNRQTTSLSLTYANEWEEYTITNAALEDPTFRDDLIALGLDPRCGTGPRCGIGAGQLSALMIDGGRNTTDSVLDAKKGYFASAHLELAGGPLGGDWNYREFLTEGRYYQSIRNRAVAAIRVRAGTINSSGLEAIEIPFFKRYFLGGATTLRGWGRYEVSPLSGAGLPIGGFSMLNFSTELRVPIVGKLNGVVFMDGGNVWSDPWEFNLNDMRYDVGPGLRYDTPVGPFRIDFGFQLNPIDGLIVNGAPQTRAMRVHFSIGQAF